MKKFITFLVMITMSVAVFSQTVLFEENFDDGTTAATSLTVSELGSNNVVDYAFDYIAAGIEAAPGGGGLGLKIDANTAALDGGSVMFYPTDGTFTGEYFLTCDLWFNYVGTESTTEAATVGVKTTSTALPQTTGVEVLLTGDGGSGDDIRLYVDGLPQYSEDFPDYWADLEWGQNVSSSDGVSDIYGAAFEGDLNGNQWLSLTVQVTTDSVFYFVNGQRWVQLPSAAAEGNVSFGYQDLFTGSIADNTVFGLFDNIKVTAGTVGVKNIVSNNVSLYPNPATDLLNVTVKENSTFELIDITGKTVLSRMVEGTSSINISKLSSGMYLAKVTSESGLTEISKVLVK